MNSITQLFFYLSLLFILFFVMIGVKNGNSFRIAQDIWFSQEKSIFKSGILSYDKIQHFLGGLILGYFFGYYGLIHANLWEIKDAYLPYEKQGAIGGDGFSVKDDLATMLGVVIVSLLI